MGIPTVPSEKDLEATSDMLVDTLFGLVPSLPHYFILVTSTVSETPSTFNFQPPLDK